MRGRLGLGLKAAKDIVDAFRARPDFQYNYYHRELEELREIRVALNKRVIEYQEENAALRNSSSPIRTEMYGVIHTLSSGQYLIALFPSEREAETACAVEQAHHEALTEDCRREDLAAGVTPWEDTSTETWTVRALDTAGYLFPAIGHAE